MRRDFTDPGRIFTAEEIRLNERLVEDYRGCKERRPNYLSEPNGYFLCHSLLGEIRFIDPDAAGIALTGGGAVEYRIVGQDFVRKAGISHAEQRFWFYTYEGPYGVSRERVVCI